MIKVRQFNLQYPNAESPLFEGAAMSVEQGQVIGLIGPNGSGKTSFFHQLMEDQQFPHTGEVRVECPQTQRQIVLQNAWLPHLLTVDELFHLIVHLNYKALNRDPEEFKEQLGIRGTRRFAHIRHRRYGKLSAGERQWFNVALGLFLGETLVLLDEPTNGLDPESRYLVWESIEFARNTGKTVLIASHLLDEIADRTDGFFLLHERRFRFFPDKESFIACFGGQNTDEAFVRAFNPAAS